jgi:choline transporter-like protein 2/4/5
MPGCLSCCGKKDDEPAKKSNPLTYKRLCTDIFCLGFFILFLGFLMFILGFAVQTGDLDSLFYDADYRGDRCGVGQHSGRPKAFYPRIPRDMIAQPDVVASGRFWNLELYTLCVSQCPTNFDINSPAFIADYGYDPASSVTQSLGSGTQPQWISATPTVDILNRCIPRTEVGEDSNTVCAFPNCTDPAVTALNAGGAAQCQTIDPDLGPGWEVCPSGTSSAVCDQQQATCVVEARKVETVVYQISAGDEASQALLSSVSSLVGGFYEIAHDLVSSWVFILSLGVLAPIVFSFAYMILLFLFAKTIIWGMLVLLVIAMLIATAICFARSGLNVSGVTAETILGYATVALNVTVPDAAASVLAATNEETAWVYTVAFWIMLILTVLTIVSIALARRKVAICAAIVKEATTVFRDIPLMMLFPTFTTLLQVLLCGYLIFGLCLLNTVRGESIDIALGLLPNSTWAVSVGETVAVPSVDPTGPLRALHDNGSLIFTFGIIHLFGFYVLTSWVAGLGWCTMSGATGWWYFFKGETEGATRIPVLRSLAVQFTFHSGSIAFAAFILAFFDMLRWALAYVERTMRPMAERNPLGRLLFRCLNCCLSCIKRTVEFISFYGLVFVAVNGTNFCKGCFETFQFFLNNMAQVSVNATCIWLLKMLGFGVCPAVCAIITLYSVDGRATTPMYPAMMVFGCALVMMNACMAVFECVITTVFVCSFEDKASYGSRYMQKHPQLIKVFGATEEYGDKAQADESKKDLNA